MKIFSSDMEVYSAGSINSDGMKPTRFSILENPKFDVIFQLLFNGGVPFAKYDVTAEGELTFSFENPDLMDFGLSSPVKIGLIEGRELYVVFRVTTHGEKTSYSLNYTFYLKVAK